jgi:hypothetical protein
VAEVLQRPDGITDRMWELITEADEVMETLDQIDVEYRRERNKIRNTLNGSRAKQRLLGRVQARWHDKREPVAERLIQLRHLIQRI